MNAHIDAPSKFVVHMGCYSSFGAYKDNESHEKKDCWYPMESYHNYRIRMHEWNSMILGVTHLKTS